MNLIPITDSKTITYMNYKGVKPCNSKREGKIVRVYYEDNNQFNEAKMDMMVDKQFHEVLTAKHNTEELLRTTI